MNLQDCQCNFLANEPECCSLEQLWENLHSRLCRFICSRINNPEDAEDILQDVFVSVHLHLDSVKNMDRLESWIYQIARNSIIDYYRQQRKMGEVPEIAVEDEYPEQDTAESLAPYLHEVVRSLPEPYRQALQMTDIEGLSQKELADRLNISISGAKSRVQRARQKVRDIMLSCCHFEFDARGIVCDYRKRCCCCGDVIP